MCFNSYTCLELISTKSCQRGIGLLPGEFHKAQSQPQYSAFSYLEANIPSLLINQLCATQIGEAKPSEQSGDDGSQASGWGHHSTSQDEKKGTVSEKTEVGCSESMQKLGGDTMAGGGGDHVPTERRGCLARQEGKGVGCYAHPNISEEESLDWVSGGKLEPGMRAVGISGLHTAGFCSTWGWPLPRRGRMTQTSPFCAPHGA